MAFNAWIETVPEAIRGDSVWKMQAYRIALFAGELAWKDATKLMSDRRTISLADQLYRSAGAVSSDIIPNERSSAVREEPPSYEALPAYLVDNLP